MQQISDSEVLYPLDLPALLFDEVVRVSSEDCIPTDELVVNWLTERVENQVDID